jgi:hypothetical protein
MNITETFGGFIFEGEIIKNEESGPLQELLKLLEGLCVFGYQGILQKIALYFG